MADETQTPPPLDAADDSKPPKTLPKWLRAPVMVAVGLFLLFVLQWAHNARIAMIRAEVFGRSVDALSASLADDMLQPDPIKMERKLTRIALASGYSRISVTDSNGQVIATTDNTQRSIVIPGLKALVPITRPTKAEGKLTGIRSIVLAGDTSLGGLEVVTLP